MIIKCYIHKKRHKTLSATSKFIDGKLETYCHDDDKPSTSSTWSPRMMTKEGRRMSHWEDISTRFATPDGKIVRGKEGIEARRELSGQTYNKPNFDRPEYQKQLYKK